MDFVRLGGKMGYGRSLTSGLLGSRDTDTADARLYDYPLPTNPSRSIQTAI